MNNKTGVIKAGEYEPSFSEKLEGKLVAIEGEEALERWAHPGIIRQEIYTILLAETKQGYVRTWFPGRIHSDMINKEFQYWISMYDPNSITEQGELRGETYCLFFPNRKYKIEARNSEFKIPKDYKQ